MSESKSLRSLILRFPRLAGAISLLLAAGCKPPPQMTPPVRPPAAVTVAAAISKDVPFYLEEIGKTTAFEYVTVQPQISGQIKSIHFVDGVDLHKKDLLFTIDPRPFEAALNQAEANTAQQTAALVFAKQDFARAEELIATKAISQQEFDQKKNAVAVSEAQVKAADAAVRIAKLNLEYCEIRSPIDGRAGQRLADVGNIVKINDQPLLIIQRLTPIYVDFTTGEQNLKSVREHLAKGTLKTNVWVPGDDQPHTGDLTFIDTNVQNGAGTIKLRATLPNDDHHFWAGQFVNVQLVLEMKKDAVLVPMQAIQLSQTGPYVFVVNKDAAAELRQVTQGQRQGDWMVIEKGVAPGDRVIITGQMLVAPGAKVNVLPPPQVAKS